MGKVTLVGAGPGDAGLITVKGLEKLKTCDVVIYDRLASDELLDAVKEDCIRVYVGKKPGAHSMKQEEINRLLVEYGQKYSDIVRLKGGDSFVFGRGGEEILALAEAGIPYEVVPGIPSPVAVPELAGIPVTHRGVARSFHVITGHTKGDGLPGAAAQTENAEDTLTDDYETLAKLDGTLVFLMGLSNLEQITGQLLHYGKAPGTPAAVIADGTTPREKVVRGTLSDITARVRAAGLKSPVVIVIGETAALHFKMEDGSAEQRFGMIGTARTMEAFRQALRETAETMELMEMQVCETKQAGRLEAALLHIRAYDWILFTSKQVVETFFGAVSRQKTDIRTLAGCRFGVIGQGTRKALEAHGIYADFMPEQADAEAFARQFAGQFGGKAVYKSASQFGGKTADKSASRFSGKTADKSASQFGETEVEIETETAGVPDNPGQEEKKPVRVLIPRAVQGNPVLGEILREAGMDVCEIPVYDVVGKSRENFSQVQVLKNFVFFSASGVVAFFAELAEQGMRLPAGSRCYCIGHQTERALEQAIAGEAARGIPEAGGAVLAGKSDGAASAGETEKTTHDEKTDARDITVVTADVQSVEGLAEIIMRTL